MSPNGSDVRLNWITTSPSTPRDDDLWVFTPVNELSVFHDWGAMISFLAGLRSALRYTVPYLAPNSYQINYIYSSLKDVFILSKLDESFEYVIGEAGDGGINYGI